MHKIYVTRGVVLGKRGAGESNTQIALLTEELGLVRASARSARKEVSKLRYGLEPLTLARYSLVRGKHDWKLTGVEHIEHMRAGGAAAAGQGKVARLLLRLVRGEEQSPELFALTVGGFLALAKASPKDFQSLECVLVLRLLASLGYVPHSPELEPFLLVDDYSPEILSEAQRARSTLVRIINASLSATGL
jgi:DNA repair protein RecO